MSRVTLCLNIVAAQNGEMPGYGIAQKTYDDFCRMTGRPQRPVNEIHVSEVEAIYSGYWKQAHCSYMPEPLDLLMLDQAVAQSPKHAIKQLQRALGIGEDGVCGQDTLAALHEEVVAVGIDAVCQEYQSAA